MEWAWGKEGREQRPNQEGPGHDELWLRSVDKAVILPGRRRKKKKEKKTACLSQKTIFVLAFCMTSDIYTTASEFFALQMKILYP